MKDIQTKSGNTSFWVIAIVAILLIVGVVWLVDTRNTNDNVLGEQDTLLIDGENDSSPNGNPDTVEVTWTDYTNDDFGFSIDRPTEATPTVEGGNHVKFIFLGPQAEKQTEITDGFGFTVSTYEKPASQTLSAFAEARYEESLDAGDSLSEPTQVTLNGMPAYRYRTESLGTITHTAVASSDGTKAYVLSYNIADPGDQNYQSIVNRMLASFEIQ